MLVILKPLADIHAMKRKNAKLMKQTILTQACVVALTTTVGLTGYAGQYDQFIHLVNHRDANGKLVRPKNSGQLEVQSVSSEKSIHSSDSVSGNPMAPQPVSHVQPTHEGVSGPTSQDPTQVNAGQHAPMALQGESHVPSSPMRDEVPQSHEPLHVETIPSLTSEDSMSGSEKASSKESHAAVASHTSMAEEEAVVQTQGQDQFRDDQSEEIVQRTVMTGQSMNYIFRHGNWGMSIPEVKTKETAEFSWELDAPILLVGEHRLGYQTQVNGVDAFLTYGFENDRLRSAKYLFETEDLENDAQPILDYKTVKAWIVKTYGPPLSEDKLWVNELYRYAPELWGRALMRGHLTIVDEWDVDGTTITLLLNGGDEEVGLMAEFMTKDLVFPTELVHAPRPATGA